MDETTVKQIAAAYQEHFYLILAIRLGIGLLTGLILFILGLKKAKRNLGLLGLATCLVAGYITPILPFVVMPVFIWLILRKPAEAETSEILSETDNDESIDVGETKSETEAFSGEKEEI